MKISEAWIAKYIKTFKVLYALRIFEKTIFQKWYFLKVCVENQPESYTKWVK